MNPFENRFWSGNDRYSVPNLFNTISFTWGSPLWDDDDKLFALFDQIVRIEYNKQKIFGKTQQNIFEEYQKKEIDNITQRGFSPIRTSSPIGNNHWKQISCNGCNAYLEFKYSIFHTDSCQEFGRYGLIASFEKVEVMMKKIRIEIEIFSKKSLKKSIRLGYFKLSKNLFEKTIINDPNIWRKIVEYNHIAKNSGQIKKYVLNSTRIFLANFELAEKQIQKIAKNIAKMKSNIEWNSMIHKKEHIDKKTRRHIDKKTCKEKKRNMKITKNHNKIIKTRYNINNFRKNYR